MTLPLPSLAIDQANYARNAWLITVPSDYPYEALLDAKTWTNFTTRLSVRDSVEVWAEDLSWGAEFRVIDKGSFGVKVGEWGGLRKFAVAVPNESVPDGYSIEYKGGSLRYCVVRKTDGKRIHEKAPEKAAALAWLQSHLVTRAA